MDISIQHSHRVNGQKSCLHFIQKHLLPGSVLRFYHFYRMRHFNKRAFSARFCFLPWNRVITKDHLQKPAGKPIKMRVKNNNKAEKYVYLCEDKSEHKNQREIIGKMLFSGGILLAHIYCLIAHVALLIFFVVRKQKRSRLYMNAHKVTHIHWISWIQCRLRRRGKITDRSEVNEKSVGHTHQKYTRNPPHKFSIYVIHWCNQF